MSEKRMTDEQIDEFLSEVKSGLSISDEDIAAASNAASSQRRDGGDNASPRTRQTDARGAAPWLIPFAAVVVVALLGSAWLHISQSNELDAMERELAALRKQSSVANDTDVLRLELDQLQARVEGLTTRLDVIRDNGADINALQQSVAEQQAVLDALSERAAKAGQTPSPADDPDSARDTAPESQPAQASEAADGGSWTVNLITVGDPVSVEHIDKQLDELGIQLRIDRVEIDDRSLKRLAVPGFGSYDEAQQTAVRLKEQLGLPEDPWISRE